jgi:hypothetical protein
MQNLTLVCMKEESLFAATFNFTQRVGLFGGAI